MPLITANERPPDANEPMKRKENHDLIKAFHRLTDAAEQYVNRSPRVKRIQEQRSALLEAIGHAQLILSVQSAA
jgi:hypothetical protein